jgi:hypothetical protein
LAKREKLSAGYSTSVFIRFIKLETNKIFQRVGWPAFSMEKSIEWVASYCKLKARIGVDGLNAHFRAATVDAAAGWPLTGTKTFWVDEATLQRRRVSRPRTSMRTEP